MVGSSKHPSNFPHSFSVSSGCLKSRCLTNVQAVSQTNVMGGYFNNRYTSAASRTDSVRVMNFAATVHYNGIVEM